MSKFALFIEEFPFEGSSWRASQQTSSINADDEPEAVNLAKDYIKEIFTGVTSLRQITAHLQRDDGTIVQELIYTRQEKDGPITTGS